MGDALKVNLMNLGNSLNFFFYFTIYIHVMHVNIDFISFQLFEPSILALKFTCAIYRVIHKTWDFRKADMKHTKLS